MGVFAYELIVGVPPFKASQMIDTARNIIHATVVFPDSVSELAKVGFLQGFGHPQGLGCMHEGGREPW